MEASRLTGMVTSSIEQQMLYVATSVLPPAPLLTVKIT